MKQKLLFLLVALAFLLPARLSAFNYKYEGVTLRYKVIDEEAKTCMVTGYEDFSGALVIPDVANDGTTDYKVTVIADKAFYRCSDLRSVVIGNSVEKIGDEAFYSCENLRSVVIPNSVTLMYYSSFQLCNRLEKSAYPNYFENPFYSGAAIAYNPEGAILEDGWIWGPEKTAVYFAPLSLEGEYSIPNSVETIGMYAFYGCSGLTSVVIPNSVTSIGWYAFQGCSGLQKSAYPDIFGYPFESGIAIPYNPEGAIIENGWIWGPGKTTVYFAPLSLEGECTLPESVTSINKYAFYGCSGLSSVTALGVSPAVMDDDTFQGLYDTVKLSVPDDAVNHYLATNWSLFKNIQNNSGNELGYFSDGVLEYRLSPSDATATVIGAKSYSNLQIPERFTDDTDAANPVRYYIKGIGYKAFDGKSVDKVEFNSRSEMEFIGDYAFAGAKFSSITLPKTVNYIGSSAFRNSQLASIAIPENVTEIKDSAFYNCTNLTDVKLNSTLLSIGNATFSMDKDKYNSGKRYGSLAIPSTLKSIGRDAFLYRELDKVNISDLRAWCDIEFSNNASNPCGWANDGFWLGENEIVDLVIPDGVTEVKPYSFVTLGKLKSVNIPSGVKSIGAQAFYECQAPSVSIPASVDYIGYGAFAWNYYEGGKAYLTSFTLEDGLTPIVIEANAFRNNAPNIFYMGRPTKSVFDGCKNRLQILTVGNTVETIADMTFYDCWLLSKLSLGSSIQSIGDMAFSGCTSLEEVILPPAVETIGAKAFSGDSSLEKIIMGHKVKSIGEKAFDGCPASTVSITAQTPPTAPNNTFSNYSGKLYVQGEKAKDAYYDAFTCWDRFDSYVMIDAEKITVEGADKISGKAGDTFQLTATVWPENVTLPQIFWRTTNPEIATVDENGLVTLHVDLESLKTRAQGDGDIDGICTIIAETLYNDGPIAQVGVTAEDDTPILVESLIIDPTTWSGVEGSEFTIKATVLPENAENKALTFESSDSSVATVDAEGNVKVLKEGTCVITVSTVDGSNIKAECVITGLSGVEAIFADPNASVDVYDMNGILLKKGCSREELKQLKPAVYILRSAETVVKAVVKY
ncbi:MAG: leucine-rich repeat protein [Muribaculaceae bacterium]|nr:leucine-rich repeat protein [Muribaculaceae bacterium]